MILATLLNIRCSREYIQGFRKILQEKLQKKTSFYCIKVYMGKMIYLSNNECIRLSCAQSITDSLLTEYLTVVVKILYITLYFLMLDWHAFIVALHCCHFLSLQKISYFLVRLVDLQKSLIITMQ